MNTLRRFSRRAWLLHGYLIASLVLLPVPFVHSGWIDTDTDAVNDTWEDTANSSSYTLAQLDALDADLDIDNDGAYNSEELAYGSDPFDLDSDDDGLTDGVEIHLAIQGSSKAYSLTAWDSNGDAVSDHDDFYGSFSVTYPGGQLPPFSGARYSDYDGDGIKNPFDSYPADPLNNDADGDGIDDSTDPALGDGSNASPHNGQSWYGGALADNDNDTILNFWDPWPGDASNGSNDSDGDTIANGSDPFPSDYSNYSPINGIYWYGDVFGDADWDWVSNYADAWPYDSSNGMTNNSSDRDNDGITNDLDPAPDDASNYSGTNGTYWNSYPLEDADNDGTNNFHDPFPYDPYNNLPDFDGDGWANADDPFPKDAANFSSLNQTVWGTAMMDDPDGDGLANWQDEFPGDTFNNNPDFDGDGIANGDDPFPKDSGNFSSVNNTAWGPGVLADDDSDGTPNWNDTTPYPPDADGDTIADPIDPYVGDPTNYSSVNGTSWGANVLGDNDNDGTPNYNDSTPWPDTDADDDGIDDATDPYVNDATNYSSINSNAWYGHVLGNADGDSLLNWEDAWPHDANNGYYLNPDRDADGYANESDPAPDDFSNYSHYNWQYWYGSALNDNDYDGTVNFYDYQPNGDGNVDSDGDGYYDSNDPAPNDSSNYSSTNGQWWYGSALNDNDADGTANFYDDYPYGPPPPPDSDGDGLDANAEATHGTSDSDVDSDDDGLSDCEEVNIFGTNPVNAHHLSQQRFSNNLYTDWQLVDLADGDGDLIPDRIEQHHGLNPGWPKDALLDRDNDGVNNLAQYYAGRALDDALSTYDADGDGMTDVFEDAYAQVLSKSNPSDAVLDADSDGVLNHEEQILLISPQNADTLQQSGLGDLQVLILSVRYPDGSNPAPDDVTPANGIPDWADALKATPTAPDHYHFTRQAADDLDGDGMPDAWEHEYGRWKFATHGLQLRSATDAGRDPDQDGLTNLTEYRFGTNPLAPETQVGVKDRSKFYRQGGSSASSSSPSTASGLMSRYRAQVAQDLAAGVGNDKTIDISRNQGLPDQNETPPRIYAEVTTQNTHLHTTTTARNDQSAHLGTRSIRMRSGCACSHTPAVKVPCMPCNGEGGDDCGSCGGDGSLNCFPCQGTGRNLCTAHTCNQGRCRTCNGSGMQSGETPCATCAGLGSCRSCAGIGYIECQFCAVSGRVRCQNCGGQGTLGCVPCRGSGEIEITPGQSYTCGMHSNPCQDCGGTGIPPADQVCGDCQNTGMAGEPCPYTHFPLTTCPECDNTGMISEPCPSCISDDGAPICAGCSGSLVVGQTTQSAVVRLEFPAGSERHMATRYKVYVNGKEYTTLSFHNRTAFIEAPPLRVSKEIVWKMLRDKGSATGRDSAGSRYRKIGLDGVPLSDSKPQSQDESGEPPEETYVDAYTRQLRHSVSDVYVQPEHGGQLPLVVRRDVSPETWSPKGGLRLPERPDLPFGPGWSSNLCSYVRFELPGPCSTAEIKATVVDETGAHQSFLLKGGWWHHSKEELADMKTAMNQFTAAEVPGSRAVTPFFPKFAGITLTKKFGTTCHYEMTDLLQAFPSDRTNNTGDHVIYRYARLVRAVDRYGNELRYDYAASASKSLIPYKIHDPQRPGHQLTIQENNGLISDIRGPGGETIHYDYSLVGAAGAPPLSSVGFTGAYALSEVTRRGESEAAGAATVKYDYSVDLETDPTPLSAYDVDVFLHLNLTSITDEMNRVFSFDYTRSRGLYYTMTQAGAVIHREQTALPDEVTSVTSPAGPVTITGVRSIRSHFMPPFMQVLTAPQTNVTGPCGTYTYHWSDPNVQVPGFSPNFGVDLGAASIPVESAESARYSLNFTRMDIVSAAGTETYQFNPTAAMALATATDISGNTTSFTYGTDGYDDPLTETDALGNTKTYTYDPTTRIMASMKDALGTVTAYGIQNQVVDGVSIQGLKVSEIVTGVGGASRTTFYKYEHPVFKGMVTSQWTLSPNATAMPANVTTTTLGAATDAQGANPGWWREVTQTTGTATSQGVLGTALTTTTTISDLGGKKRSVIDGRGLITNFDYDELGRLIQVRHPDLSHKDLGYDAHGNLIHETNENGVKTFHGYDVMNRRTKSTVDLNGNGVADASCTTDSAPVYDGDLVTTTTYNAFNQPVNETNARGVVTHHDYDSAGRRIATVVNASAPVAEQLVTFYTDENPATPDFVGGSVFDSSGFKPLRVISPAGYATHFEYDALYREAGRRVFYGHELTLNPRYLAHQAARAHYSAQTAMQAATQAAAAAQSASAEAAQAVNAVASAQQALGSATATLDARLTALDAAVAAAGGVAPYLLAVAAAQTSAGTAAATLNSATSQLTNAQAALSALQAADPNADTFSAQQAVDLAQAAVDDATTAHDDSQTARAAAETALADHTLPLRQAVDNATSAYTAVLPAVTQAESDLATAQAANDQALLMVELTIEGTQERTDALSAFAAAAAALQAQQGGLASANAAVSQAQQQVADASSALGNATSGSMGSAKAAFDSATQAQADAQQTVQTAQAYSATTAAQAQSRQAAATAASAAATAAATHAAAAVAAKTIQEADQAASAALVQAGIATTEAGQPPPTAGAALPPAMALPEAETHTTYDAVGKPLTVTDPLGRVTRNTYDGLGQLVKVTEPDTTADLTDNPTVQTLYTHHGKPWKVIDQMGNVTTTRYDAAGRAVEVKAPAVNGPGGQGVQAITTTEYDASGNAIRVTDALGRETETVYDERNRPVAVYAPTVWDANAAQFVRPTSQTTYDALGQVLTVTDPMGAVTTKHYDRAGRNWKVEAPAPEWSAQSPVRPTTITTFDPGGLALTVTNPLGQTVTNTYDALGRLIITEDAESIINSFGYDAAGNRTSVTDGKNQTTTFVYDGLNRLVEQSFASVTEGEPGDTWSYQYNAVQKLSQTSPRGIVTSYGYDARDRLLTVSAPAHEDTSALDRSYTYDSAGKLRTVTEAGNSAANVSYVYDALGSVTAESSRGQVHFYQYDLAGNRVKASYSTGRVVETSYDGLNRPEVIAEGGRVTQYGYDLAGRAVILIAANGQTSQNSHDALGRLKDRTLFKTAAMSDTEVLAQFEWEHDLLGNVLAQHETWPGEVTRPQNIRSTVMGYDDNNRLLSETIQTRSNGSAPAVDQSLTEYSYDDANNRASKTVTLISGTTSTEAGENEIGHWEYEYNSANQLVSWEKLDYPSGSVQKSAMLEYDAAGNRTSQDIQDLATSNQHLVTNYAWDAQDRLASVTMPDGTVHDYEYDYRTRRIGTGARTSPSALGTLTAIVFAGGLSLAEYDVSASPSSSIENPAASIVQYMRGPDMGGGVGGLLYTARSQSTPGLQPVLKYNLSNGRGDIVAQADQAATLTWTASYEAYGKRTKETGTNQDKQRANSKDEDPTGLLNEGFRYRDIDTGTWMSRDPAGFVDGPNLYAYVKQNPWTGWDPKGLRTQTKSERKALDHMDSEVTESRRQESIYRGEAKKSSYDKKTRESLEKEANAWKHYGDMVETSARATRDLISRMTDDSDDISSFIRGHSASWAQMASGEIGVTEDSKGWDARVKEYQYSTDVGREFFTDDGVGENAWCACFVNWSMEKTGQTGLAGYDGVRAKSWKDWGESSSKPYFGAVGVMKSGGTFHHVGFVVGTAGDEKNPKVVMLGGNQGDTVNISVFDQSKFLEYRLPTGYSGSKMEVHLSDVSGLSGGGSTR